MLKKLLLSLLVFLFMSIPTVSLFTSSASALDYDPENYSWYHQDYFDWFERVYNPDNEDEIFGERYTQAQVEWIIYSFFTFMWNQIGNPDVNWCLINVLRDKDGSILSIAEAWIQTAGECGDAIKSWFTNVLDALTPLSYNYPHSPSSEYDNSNNYVFALFTKRELSLAGAIKRSFSRLSIVEDTYAAEGFGYTAIENLVSKLWSKSRDISYFFLVMAIVIMSFMIMFRTKISPQTVITVQSALPKIIITLILITFSYAIGGFLIDLMYAVIGLVSALLFQADLTTFTWTSLFSKFTQTSSVTMLLQYWLIWIVASFIASWNFIGALIGNALASILIFAVWLILIIVLLIASFKTWWMLIKNYISILFQIALAPFIILGGVFGFGGGFGGWIKNLIAALAVYPVAGLILFFAFFMLRAAIPASGIGLIDDFITGWFPFNPNPWVANATEAWDPPLTLGTGTFELMMCFASLSVLMLLPKTIDIVKSFFAGKPFGYGSAIGESLAPGVALGWGAGQYVSSKQKASYDPLTATGGQKKLNSILDALSQVTGGKIKR